MLKKYSSTLAYIVFVPKSRPKQPIYLKYNNLHVKHKKIIGHITPSLLKILYLWDTKKLTLTKKLKNNGFRITKTIVCIHCFRASY